MKLVQEMLSGCAVAVTALIILLRWNGLPERIAIHFDASGHANGFGGRDALWVLFGLQVFLFVLLSVVGLLPRLFNLPVARSDPRRAHAERLAVEMLGWIKVEVLWLFTFMIWKVLAVALGRTSGPGVAFLPVFSLMLAITVVGYVLQMRRHTPTNQA